MSAQETVGKIIADDEQQDAIHFAVAPVVAAQMLLPGSHVGFVEDGNQQLVGAAGKHLGIVDPFLTSAVKQGERFWLFLYPNTISGLRHQWTHPAFWMKPPLPNVTISNDDHKKKSIEWIRLHAEDMGLSASALMDNAREWIECEEHQVQQGSEHWRSTFNAEHFWHHYEIATGEIVPNDKKHSFYCCTC